MSRFLAAGVLFVLAGAVLAGPQEPPPLPPPPTRVPGGPDLDGGFAPFRPAAQQFKELVPALVGSLGDADSEVRQHAATALAALGKDAMPALLEALKDAQKERRAGAAYALGQMGFMGRDAIPALLTTLKDTETIVKRSAAMALSRILAEEQGGYGFGGAMPGGPFPPPRGFAVPGVVAPATPPPLPVPPKSERGEPAKRDPGR